MSWVYDDAKAPGCVEEHGRMGSALGFGPCLCRESLRRRVSHGVLWWKLFLGRPDMDGWVVEERRRHGHPYVHVSLLVPGHPLLRSAPRSAPARALVQGDRDMGWRGMGRAGMTGWEWALPRAVPNMEKQGRSRISTCPDLSPREPRLSLLSHSHPPSHAPVSRVLCGQSRIKDQQLRVG